MYLSILLLGFYALICASILYRWEPLSTRHASKGADTEAQTAPALHYRPAEPVAKSLSTPKYQKRDLTLHRQKGTELPAPKRQKLQGELQRPSSPTKPSHGHLAGGGAQPKDAHHDSAWSFIDSAPMHVDRPPSHAPFSRVPSKDPAKWSASEWTSWVKAHKAEDDEVRWWASHGPAQRAHHLRDPGARWRLWDALRAHRLQYQIQERHTGQRFAKPSEHLFAFLEKDLDVAEKVARGKLPVGSMTSAKEDARRQFWKHVP